MSSDHTPAQVPLTFVLPGFSKCGTTTLAALLQQHPDLLLPTKLEPWFFIEDDFADRWDGYAALYPHANRYRAVGDDSTAYTSFRVIDKVAARLLRHYPELRLVFIARDPVARVESSFREFHSSGPLFGIDTPFSLEQAMRELPQLVEDSRYWARITTYREHFDDDRIHVLFFEDLVADPTDTMARCFRFLGLDPARTAIEAAPRLNPLGAKLRDTALLRRVRNNRVTGPKLARVPVRTQDRYLTKVRLRRRFTEPIEWTSGALAEFRERIHPDAVEFLARYGGPVAGWSRTTALAESVAAAGTSRP